MSKEVEVKISDPSRGKRSYVGRAISNGPGLLRLLITRPYRLAGRTVEVPVEQVEEVVLLERGDSEDRPVSEKLRAMPDRAVSQAPE